MAATLTPHSELTFMSFPLEKSKTEITADGDVIVYGKATDGIVDSDQQIVDPVWAAKAIREWLDSGANIRVQHQSQRDPAGKGIEVTNDGVGGQWVRALVVEPVAKQLVLKGVLQAFSVGIMNPNIVHDPLAVRGRINGGEFGEISLVDRPANKNCRFELVKSAANGSPTYIGKMYGIDTLEKVGPHGYEHDWVYVGGPGLPKVPSGGGESHAASAAHAPAAAAGHVADHIASGKSKPKDLSDKDLKDADAEFARRATALGKTGQVSGSHKKVKTEITRRKTAKQKSVDADLGKRDFDAGVGGGVDRDTIPAADFAGPDRTFPIVTPKDVADAWGLSGHGADPAAVRQKIKNIAQRKGPSFVARLPDSSKGGQDHMDKQSDDDLIEKGGKQCPVCDRYNKKDATECSARDCDHQFKTVEPDTAKGKGGPKDSTDTAGDDDFSHGPGENGGDAGDDGADSGDDDDDDSDDDLNKSAKKSRMACGKCSGMMKGKNKFCPNCGAPAAVQKGLVTAGRTEPTPADGVTGQHADHVPAHREPDGHAIEAFEADAKIPTDPDSMMKAAHRIASSGAPDDLGVLHDLLCPAFSHKALTSAYPFTDVQTHIDTTAWQMKALDAAASAPLEEAARATKRWQDATIIASVPAEVIAELRSEAHKSFKDANPGVASFPAPSSVTPGQFKRPYVSAGHARPSFQQEGPNTAPVPSGQISAGEFDRSNLTSGHASDSPANKSANRAYYTNAQKDNAMHAMQAMHDHISHMFPDICAMGGDAPAQTGPMDAPPVGDTVKSAAPVAAPVETLVTKAAVVTEDGALTHALTPDLVKSAVAEATSGLTDRLLKAEAALKAQKRLNKSLAGQIDTLADQANPAINPYKGMAFNPILKGVDAGRVRTPEELAAYSQLSVQQDLVDTVNNSTDPRQREAARIELMKMRGIAS